MISITTSQLFLLLNSFIWPLTRILGLITVAPPFGNSAVPNTIKLSFGISLALIVSAQLPENSVPIVDPLSLSGFAILIQQFIIGASMGFVMRLVFAAIEMAGEISGLTMGLGFATFFDPLTQGRTSAISQFLVLFSTLLFLSLNIHLSLLQVLIESFQTMPLNRGIFENFSPQKIALFGSHVFSIGMQLSLPIVAALLITNVALGILTRAAPQLNLFGIGFPVTITIGLLMLGMITPYLLVPLEKFFQIALNQLQNLTPTLKPSP